MIDEMKWPEVFRTRNLDGKSDKELCGIGLCAWANCLRGIKPCETFGEIIAKISSKLGIIGTPESFMEFAKRYTSKTL